MKNITVRNLYKQTENFKDKNIIIEGWVKTLRDSKTFGFIELNDGTFFKNIQIVFNDSLSNFEEIRKLTGEELENKKQEYIKELHNELEKVMIENEDAIKIQQDFAIANLNSGYQDGETRIKFEHTNIEMSSFTFDGDQVTVSINGQIETASNYMNDNNEIKEKQNSMPIAMEEITLQKVNGKWKVVYANLIYYSENSYQNSINMY